MIKQQWFNVSHRPLQEVYAQEMRFQKSPFGIVHWRYVHALIGLHQLEAGYVFCRTNPSESYWSDLAQQEGCPVGSVSPCAYEVAACTIVLSGVAYGLQISDALPGPPTFSKVHQSQDPFKVTISCRTMQRYFSPTDQLILLIVCSGVAP